VFIGMVSPPRPQPDPIESVETVREQRRRIQVRQRAADTAGCLTCAAGHSRAGVQGGHCRDAEEVCGSA
jgi:hypothetical protein